MYTPQRIQAQSQKQFILMQGVSLFARESLGEF